MSFFEKFNAYVEKHPVSSRAIGIAAVAAIFIAASQGGKNIKALGEFYDSAKDGICETLSLDCELSQ